MDSIVIRKASLDDLNDLISISRKTFTETFSGANTEEDFNEYLESAYSQKKLSKELNQVHSTFYLCFVHNKLAGYLKLNTGENQSEAQGDSSLEIERIYFLSEFQGKGLGSKFFELATEQAVKDNKSRIWLGVWEENKKALSVYKHKGFIPFSEHVFTVGNNKQRDILMEKTL